MKTAKHTPMPSERPSITHKFRVADMEGYIVVGLYPDGAPGEIFLYFHEEGSMARGFTHIVAVMISTALQHGVPLSRIVDKLKSTRFEPQGFTANKEIPMVTSIADYIGRWLEMRFLINTGEQK